MILLLLLGCRSVLQVDGDPAGASERWDRALKEVVVDGKVDLHRLTQRRAALHDYVVWISRPQVFGGRIKSDRHAFWLNALQALSLVSVLERRPSSLQTSSWVDTHFMSTAFVVGGETMSLSDIVHERLRLKELDFRDHAAMVFGNRGGPPARPGIYRSDGLSEQLDAAMVGWVAAEAVRIEGDTAVFAERFSTYSKDFAPPDAPTSLCALVAPYAIAHKRAQLKALHAKGCRHRFAMEDWSVALPGG